jgi:septum formation protein
MNEIILASASIGRKRLFEKYFTEFTISVSDFDESSVQNVSPSELTRLLALYKAGSVSDKFPSDFVIGFDTVVVCEGKILGKPADLNEARQILRFLSGKKQSVLSGYAIIRLDKGIEISGVGETVLLFKNLTDEFIEGYIREHPVMKYAGAYGVQDKDELIQIIKGGFDNVIGASMDEIIAHLKKVGLPGRLFKLLPPEN